MHPVPRHFIVRFDPELVFRRTIWAISILVGASLMAAFIHLEFGHSRLFGLSNLVNLDKERNLPTMFSLVQLLAAGALAWHIGRKEPVAMLRGLWRFLGAGLIWIGLDDAIGIHENANRLDLGSWRDSSYLQFAWVVPGTVVAVACTVILLKLLQALPRKTARMFVLSGALFVGGSLGVEMLGSHYYDSRPSWSYTFCYTIEESLEMLGPALFIRTTLRYALELQHANAGTGRAVPESMPA
jgi:hypothetical protein